MSEIQPNTIAKGVNKMNEIICPKCGTKMHKAGFIWSGLQKVQRYRCPKCGTTHAPVNKPIDAPSEA